MIQIPKIKSHTSDIGELKKELNAILTEIETQVNRELNNIESENSEKGQ